MVSYSVPKHSNYREIKHGGGHGVRGARNGVIKDTARVEPGVPSHGHCANITVGLLRTTGGASSLLHIVNIVFHSFPLF